MQTDSVVVGVDFNLDTLGNSSTLVAATLRYDVADPFAVCVSFDAGGGQRIEWIFSRELLAHGLSHASGEGDVTVAPRGSVIVVTLRSPSGRAILHTDLRPVANFVARTLRLVPLGEECAFVDIDSEIAALF